MHKSTLYRVERVTMIEIRFVLENEYLKKKFDRIRCDVISYVTVTSQYNLVKLSV